MLFLGCLQLIVVALKRKGGGNVGISEKLYELYGPILVPINID